MFCPHCGSSLADGSAFCSACGAALNDGAAAPSLSAAGPKPSPNIECCPDGVYRWIYEFDMKRNPVLLLTILKVFGIVCAALWLLTTVISLTDGDGLLTALWINGRIIVLVFIGLAVLTIPAYLIVTAMNGGKYIVLFEMDENGITHRQQEKQFTKAQGLMWLTAMAGAALHSPVTAGAGFLGATRDSLHSDFAKVKRMKVLRRWNTVKLNQPLAKNQVYAEPEDFDFVLNYILARIPDAAKG